MIPILSIIIPVYKENILINNTIQHIRALKDSNRIEIIVVDGDQNNSTIKYISDNNVIKISSVKGRSTQMNAGAEIAKGEILVFLHVDTILPFNAFERIHKIMNIRNYKVGVFNLSINSKKIIFKVIGYISSIRSRITRIPYGDQTFFIKKDYFYKIGKFKNIPIMEDVELMQRIKKSKTKIFIAKEKVLTSDRRWREEGVIRCTLRNWILINLYYLGFKPEKLVKFYK